jgi:hypothetical protein
MTHAWGVVVVRAWQHKGRRIIRMTMSSGANRPPGTFYSASSRSAGDRLSSWLEEEWPTPRPLPEAGSVRGDLGEAGESDLDGTRDPTDRPDVNDS